MRRFFYSIIICLILFSLLACNGGNSSGENDKLSLEGSTDTQEGVALADVEGLTTECVHSWLDATCTEPRTCRICGIKEGEALGHDWTNATYESPAICRRCGEEGDILSSYYDVFSIDDFYTVKSSLYDNAEQISLYRSCYDFSYVSGHADDGSDIICKVHLTELLPEHVEERLQLTGITEEMYEIKDDYEIRIFDITMGFDKSYAETIKHFGASESFADKYGGRLISEDADVDEGTLTIEYNGETVVCKAITSTSMGESSISVDGVVTGEWVEARVSYYIYLPSDYDGLCIAFYDGENSGEVDWDHVYYNDSEKNFAGWVADSDTTEQFLCDVLSSASVVIPLPKAGTSDLSESIIEEIVGDWNADFEYVGNDRRQSNVKIVINNDYTGVLKLEDKQLNFTWEYSNSQQLAGGTTYFYNTSMNAAESDGYTLLLIHDDFYLSCAFMNQDGNSERIIYFQR